jgi:hypothetical protein
MQIPAEKIGTGIQKQEMSILLQFKLFSFSKDVVFLFFSA